MKTLLRLFTIILYCTFGIVQYQSSSITLNNIYAADDDEEYEDDEEEYEDDANSSLGFGAVVGVNMYKSAISVTVGADSATGSIQRNFVNFGLTFHHIPENGFSFIMNTTYWKYLGASASATQTVNGITQTLNIQVDPNYSQDAVNAEFFFGNSFNNFVIGAGPTLTYALKAKFNGTTVDKTDGGYVGLGAYLGYKANLGAMSIVPHFSFSYTVAGFGAAEDAVPSDVSLSRYYINLGLAFVANL